MARHSILLAACLLLAAVGHETVDAGEPIPHAARPWYPSPAAIFNPYLRPDGPPRVGFAAPTTHFRGYGLHYWPHPHVHHSYYGDKAVWAYRIGY